MSLWIDHLPPVGETASRLAYIQKSEAHILHGRLFSAAHTQRISSSPQRSREAKIQTLLLCPLAHLRQNRTAKGTPSASIFHSSGSTCA
jgi:hypothetical protein